MSNTAKTVVVTNRKGGVGKTTIASHLASGLALRGYRVGLIDTDSQGHLAMSFGLKKENGLYRLMCDEDTSFQDVIRIVPPERIMPPDHPTKPQMFIIPSDKMTVRIPIDNQNPFAFRTMIEEYSQILTLDWIIIDTGPTASLFDGSVNFSANYFVYVTELSYMSFDGLNESMREMEQLNKQNMKYRTWNTEVLGIVPNKARFKTNIQRQKTEELMKRFSGLIWQPVPLSTIWEEASAYQQTVYSLASDSDAVKHIERLIDQFLKGAEAHG